MSNNFIPCVKWVQRGVAKSKPEVVHLTKEDRKALLQEAQRKQLKLENADILKHSKKKKAQTASGKDKHELETEDDQSKATSSEDLFDMQDYDQNEDGQSFIDIGNIICLDDSDNENSEEQDEEDDSEREDDEIKPNDNLIAVGHVHGDASYLEVYVYNEEDNDLYVHHDIMLPSIPLCMDWLSHDPTNTACGNLLAIGSISPEILIWNLDVVNNIEPHATLGMYTLKKMYQHRNHGHTDAVLDLCWNSKLSHVLASGSVDRTVLLWDLDKKRAISKFNKFLEKVQTIQWHPSEANIILAGSCDGLVRLLDCRVLLETVFNGLEIQGEVEKVAWHPYNHFHALIGTSKGELHYADLRTKKSLWKIQAHSKEITGIEIHPDNIDTLVTCSIDQSIKIWDWSSKEPPVLLNTRYNNQGIQCLQMCPENSNIFCIGGDGKQNNFSVQVVKDAQESQLIDMSGDSQE